MSSQRNCLICKHYKQGGFCEVWGRHVINSNLPCTSYFVEKNYEIEMAGNDPYLVSLIRTHNSKINRLKTLDKMIKGDSKRISKDDIINMKIDLWTYNQGCRKAKIKRVYKRKKKEPI